MMLPPRKIKQRSLPKVRKKPRRTSAIKCRAHLNWVKREFDCLVNNYACSGPVDPHHVVSRGAGGGDEQVVSLCRFHHDGIHRLGKDAFEKCYRVDLAETAAALWKASPHRIAYERKQKDQS